MNKYAHLFLFCSLIICQAQTNLILTNDIAIGNTNWFPAIHFSYGNRDNIEVKAEDVNSLILWNSLTNKGYELFLPMPGNQTGLSPFLHLKMMTTNGIIIPPTMQGSAFTSEPKWHTERFIGENNAAWEAPKLTGLFNFQSNGVYILEARIRWWSPKDKVLLLSDPVRVKVVVRNIASTNALQQN